MLTDSLHQRSDRKSKQATKRIHLHGSKITLVLVISLIVVIMGGAGACPVWAETTREALDQAKQKQQELAEQKAKLESENRQLSEKMNELTGELAWLNQRSEEQKQLYLEKTQQLEAAVDEMEKAYTAYIQAEEDLARKQEQYVERMQVMFDHRQKSIFELFLEAESLQGFFTTLQFMAIVADTDEQMIEQLETAKDHAALKRDLARQYSEDMADLVAQIEEDLAILKADAEARQEDLGEIEIQLTTIERAEDELNEESERIAAQVVELQEKLDAEKAAAATKAAQATRAAQQAAKPDPTTSEPNSKGWVWPYPGDHTVYSPFGMRLHPIYRIYRFHSGVDLGGTYGNPIVAAADGTVILVRNTWEGRNTGGSGYGNYLVIDHGNGISTLYAHLKNTYVTVGQSVQAGEKVASCGSTGVSTGPHLHFEVRVNGNPVNPLPYIR